MKKNKRASVVFVCILVACIYCSLSVWANTQQKTGRVLEDNIRVRTDSTITATALGTINSNDTVAIISEKFEWYKIILPEDFPRYVASKYLNKTDRDHALVTATNLNIRSKPSLAAPIIGRLTKGEKVTLLRDEGPWSRIKSSRHAYGWVHKKFVTLIEARQPVPKQKEITHVPPEDEFALRGKLHKLTPLKNCEANYKLRTPTGIAFLRISQTETAEPLRTQDVTVTGVRKKRGCSYIEVEHISPSQ